MTQDRAQLLDLKRNLEEIAPDIAWTGPSDELAAAIGVLSHELDQLLTEHATIEMIEVARGELARHLLYKLDLMVPEAMNQLKQAVGKGNMRAIENVLDRGGFPRTTRSDINQRNLNLNADLGPGFSKYVEDAGGDLGVVEDALAQMKADAIDGDFKEVDDGG